MRNDDSSFSLTAYTIKNELLFKTKFYLYIKLNFKISPQTVVTGKLQDVL